VSAFNKKILSESPTGYVSGPVGIQTPNLLIRSQMLYSVELRARLMFQKLLPDSYRDDFWTANVNNKFTRPNKRFGPEYKKAIFEPYF
jgi:hypothetical protein